MTPDFAIIASDGTPCSPGSTKDSWLNSNPPLPADAGPDSLSFLPVLLGRQPGDKPVRDLLVVGRAIRSGPWKWIDGRETLFFARAGSGTYPAKDEAPGQLYNLDDDPRETTNLAAARPEIVNRFKQELARRQKGQVR